MTDQLRRVFETALTDNEPPSTAQPSDLAGKGRRKQRHRRIGYATSGTALALAAVAGLALIMPGAGGDQDDKNGSVSVPGGDKKDKNGSVETGTLEHATINVQVDFEKTYGEDVEYRGVDDQEPFEMTTEEDPPKDQVAFGQAVLPDSENEQVRVALAPPGQWEDKAVTAGPDDSMFDQYLINCWSGTEDKIERTATCKTKDLSEDGRIRTVVAIDKDPDGVVTTSYRSALFRPDGTVVALDIICGDGTSADQQCDRDDLLTADADKIEKFLTGMGTIPKEWQD